MRPLRVLYGASHRAEQLRETGPPRPVTYLQRKGEPKGRSTVLVTALGSWGKPAPRGHEDAYRLTAHHSVASTTRPIDWNMMAARHCAEDAEF
jgi:hypothetical protein